MHMHAYLVPTLVVLGANTIQANLFVERAELDGECVGGAGAPGVCLPTADCLEDGGAFISNACPGLPEDVKCCTKTVCGTGGDCRFTSACETKNFETGLCPGPADFKCCLPASDDDDDSEPPTNGGGGSNFPPPVIPALGACQAVAVDGAKNVVAAFPGEVRELFCIRDCPCPSDSDHCCGKAIDYMCSSGGGVETDSGEPIAEYMMNNRDTLNLKYVIWGQKIWNPSRDAPAPWSEWRQMEDRGSITQNHWDHVHASFN